MPTKPRKARQSAAKLSAAALRKLAQAHTGDAVQTLVAVATKGNSEASRIAAALALLDRGYGKPGAGMALEGGVNPSILYYRIELIDGVEDQIESGHLAPDDKD